MDTDEQEKKLNIKELTASVWWVIKIFWKISPFYTASYFLAQIFQGFNGVIYTYIVASAIDTAIKLEFGPETLSHLIPLGVILLAFYVLSSLIGRIGSYASNEIAMLTQPKIRFMFYEKLRSLGIEPLEKPKINNLVDRAQRDIHSLYRQLTRIVDFVASIVTTVGVGIILFNFSPAMIAIIFIVGIPSIFIDQKHLSSMWQFGRETTEGYRKANDAIFTLIDSQKLHELIITKGYRLLEKIYNKFMDFYILTLREIRKKWYTIAFLINIFESTVYAGSFVYVFYSFIQGAITVGTTTFILQNIQSFIRAVDRININYTQIYESALRISEIQDVFGLSPSFEDGNTILAKLTSGPEIKIKDVNFSYPESDKKVIKNLNLNIKTGEKIAIVGHNGAGKTTLVKLIARFYQVDSGEITINGKPINDLKIESLYQNMSVLFQEFNTYRFLTAKENVQIGNVDKKATTNSISKAAEKADAHDFIKEYKNGYDEILSEKYKGGIRPSTGQWQKIAIARFFYRNSPLVIFDEPTAAIDALAEQKIFNKIYKSFKGKTVIIISHRFSTVRNADRIIVFDKGKIVEQGSHEKLMKKDGVYAEAFLAQAEGYN